MKNLFLIYLLFSASLIFAQKNQKQIAITIDDLPFVLDISLQKTQEDTRKILEVLNKYQIQACGFVNEDKLNRNNGKEIEKRTELLENWLKAGQELGNHTFSHLSFNQNSLEDFKHDFLKGEIITEKLLQKYKQKNRYFRYPFLQAGNDSLKKYGFLEFLKQKNYQNAPVTIDNEDYIFNKVYVDAYKKQDLVLMKKAVDSYLLYLNGLFDYFENLTQIIEGRQANQIFLCHANMINADNFDKVFDLMLQRGYRFVNLEMALSDKIYLKEEKYVGKGGFSWLHRWRITDKIVFNEAEPAIDATIMKLYEGR